MIVTPSMTVPFAVTTIGPEIVRVGVAVGSGGAGAVEPDGEAAAAVDGPTDGEAWLGVLGVATVGDWFGAAVGVDVRIEPGLDAARIASTTNAALTAV